MRIIDDTDPNNPITLASLSAGAVFGERSLLFNATVSATVRAASKIDVLSLPPSAFRQMVSERPEIAQAMIETIRQDDRFNFFRSVPVFAGFSISEIERLNEAAERIALQPGEVLIGESSTIEHLWLVESGELRVSVGSPSRDAAEDRSWPTGDWQVSGRL